MEDRRVIEARRLLLGLCFPPFLGGRRGNTQQFPDSPTGPSSAIAYVGRPVVLGPIAHVGESYGSTVTKKPSNHRVVGAPVNSGTPRSALSGFASERAIEHDANVREILGLRPATLLSDVGHPVVIGVPSEFRDVLRFLPRTTGTVSSRVRYVKRAGAVSIRPRGRVSVPVPLVGLVD